MGDLDYFLSWVSAAYLLPKCLAIGIDTVTIVRRDGNLLHFFCALGYYVCVYHHVVDGLDEMELIEFLLRFGVRPTVLSG